MAKRCWYVAISDMSGEYEGNPPTFDASIIYGPYTREQVGKIEKFDDQFPHATKSITAFEADERPPFRTLLKIVKAEVAQAEADEARRVLETQWAIDAANNPGVET